VSTISCSKLERFCPLQFMTSNK